MKTKKKTKIPKLSPEQTAEMNRRAEAHYANERALIATLDIRCPPAHGTTPLFRMRLARPECTMLGYHLLDVIAVIEGQPEPKSRHAFPTYICLGLSSRGWMTVELAGYEGAVEMEEAYEIVAAAGSEVMS